MWALLRQSGHFYVLENFKGQWFYLTLAGEMMGQPTAKALMANSSSNFRKLPIDGLADIVDVLANHPSYKTVTEEGWRR